MKERVHTLMFGSAWERYGEKFVSTFSKFWPSKVELWIFTDKPLPTDRAHQVLLSSVSAYTKFMDKYGSDRKAMGYGCSDAKTDPEKRFWKKDAAKWGPQGLVPRVALDGLGSGDLLCWLDADVETIDAVPLHWINVLLAGADVACLQRERQHSEIGFWAARVGVKTIPAIKRFSELYESGDVFGLSEWHSAFVFDQAIASCPDLAIRNLSPIGRGHVWPGSQLARYTIHKKGKIKDIR